MTASVLGELAKLFYLVLTAILLVFLSEGYTSRQDDSHPHLLPVSASE